MSTLKKLPAALTSFFTQYSPENAGEPTESVATLAELMSIKGTTVKILDSLRSLVIKQADGTSALITLSKKLTDELKGGLNPAELGGCEIHNITQDVDGNDLDEPYLRLQRPAGSAGLVLTTVSATYTGLKKVAVNNNLKASLMSEDI